jgi:hypothetical protein
VTTSQTSTAATTSVPASTTSPTAHATSVCGHLIPNITLVLLVITFISFML